MSQDVKELERRVARLEETVAALLSCSAPRIGQDLRLEVKNHILRSAAAERKGPR